jgi:hypothetical protein
MTDVTVLNVPGLRVWERRQPFLDNILGGIIGTVIKDNDFNSITRIINRGVQAFNVA